MSEKRELLHAYGEAMLYSHLIEDLLRLIVRDAGFFKINGYEAPNPFPWQPERLINEFEMAFPDAGLQARDLQRLRKIRNKLTHALILQVGSDLSTDAGRDQIHAMLQRFIISATAYQDLLSKVFLTIQSNVIEHNPTRIFDRENESTCGSVSTSDIELLLNELELKQP